MKSAEVQSGPSGGCFSLCSAAEAHSVTGVGLPATTVSVRLFELIAFKYWFDFIKLTVFLLVDTAHKKTIRKLSEGEIKTTLATGM